MNILLVSPLPPPAGGIASWICRYREYCEQHGIRLSIVNIAVRGKRVQRIIQKRSPISEVRRTVGMLADLMRKLRKEKPVIAIMDSNELVDDLVHYDAGVHITPGDAAGLAKTIVILKNNPQPTYVIGQNTRLLYLKKHAPEICLTAYKKLVESAYGSGE